MRRHLCLLLSLVLAGVLLSYVVPASAGPHVPGPRPVAGVWRWPLDGTPRVTRRFDPPDTPYGSGHRGVDLAGRPGEVVRAAGAGRVGYAGVLAGRGVVTVRHPDGLKTTYEPVSATVHAGQQVTIGALLGRLHPGHLGCPVSACLHWGLLRGTVYLDPLSLLGQGRVRLLPLRGDPVAGALADPNPVAGAMADSDPLAATTATRGDNRPPQPAHGDNRPNPLMEATATRIRSPPPTSHRPIRSAARPPRPRCPPTDPRRSSGLPAIPNLATPRAPRLSPVPQPDAQTWHRPGT